MLRLNKLLHHYQLIKKSSYIVQCIYSHFDPEVFSRHFSLAAKSECESQKNECEK